MSSAILICLGLAQEDADIIVLLITFETSSFHTKCCNLSELVVARSSVAVESGSFELGATDVSKPCQ